MKNDVAYQRYYDEAILLLKTGLCISEFCGLTIKDIDFENKLINVDHQKGSFLHNHLALQYRTKPLRNVYNC